MIYCSSALCFIFCSESLHVGKRFALAFPQIREYSTDVKLVFVNADQTDIQITVQYPNNTTDTVSVTENGKNVSFAILQKLSHPCQGEKLNNRLHQNAMLCEIRGAFF